MNDIEKVKEFMKKLEDTLKKKGISKPNFAKEMGVGKMQVYRWISGEQIMTLEKYYRALEILEMTDEVIK
jgi:transcriptional regulator with XRE-family HTH domain